MVQLSFSACLSSRPVDTISLFMICHLIWFYRTVLICDREATLKWYQRGRGITWFDFVGADSASWTSSTWSLSLSTGLMSGGGTSWASRRASFCPFFFLTNPLLSDNLLALYRFPHIYIFLWWTENDLLSDTFSSIHSLATGSYSPSHKFVRYLFKADCWLAPGTSGRRLLQDPFAQMVRNLLFEKLISFTH